MRQAVPMAAGLALMALAGACPTPARAQYYPRPYPYYYPGPVYPPTYYQPPPVYRYVPPPPVYSPPVYSPPVYVPPPPPRPSASLMETQRLLAQLGYDPGPTDGLAGPRLSDAVQAFQRDHDQVANGRLSGETIGAIREAARVRDTQVVPVPSPMPAPSPAFDSPRFTPPPAAPLAPAGAPRPTLSVKPTSP